MPSYRDLDRECLLRLGAIIPVANHPRRSDFFDTIVNNTKLQTLAPDGRVVVRVESNDLKKVADLEHEAGFTCPWASVKSD